MFERLATPLVVTLLLLTPPASLAAPSREAGVPHRYIAGALDDGLVRAEDPVHGTIWSAWAYRDGGEYSIALAVTGADGQWSEPVFIGRDDGLNQVQPSLVADPSGHLYVAWAVRESGAIYVAVRRAGQSVWSEPLRVNAPGGNGSAPTLRVIGDRLVIAYREGAGVALDELPLLGLPIGTLGIIDSPDPVERGTDPGKDERDRDRFPRASGWVFSGEQQATQDLSFHPVIDSHRPDPERP